MKYTLFFIAAANLAFTTPVTERASDLVERTSTSTPELATFDDLGTPSAAPALNTVPVPYKNLNFSAFNFQAAGTAGVADGVFPESGSDYAANGPLSPSRTPMFTVQGTPKTTKFDLQSFYYGCLVPDEVGNAQVASPCAFNVTCVKAGTGAKVGPKTFNFSPTSLTNATMEEATFGSTFAGLKEATLALTSGTVKSTLTVLLVDSVKYLAYTK